MHIPRACHVHVHVHVHAHVHACRPVHMGMDMGRRPCMHAYAQVDGHADASAVLIDLLLLGQVRWLPPL